MCIYAPTCSGRPSGHRLGTLMWYMQGLLASASTGSFLADSRFLVERRRQWWAWKRRRAFSAGTISEADWSPQGMDLYWLLSAKAAANYQPWNRNRRSQSNFCVVCYSAWTRHMPGSSRWQVRFVWKPFDESRLLYLVTSWSMLMPEQNSAGFLPPTFRSCRQTAAQRCSWGGSLAGRCFLGLMWTCRRRSVYSLPWRGSSADRGRQEPKGGCQTSAHPRGGAFRCTSGWQIPQISHWLSNWGSISCFDGRRDQFWELHRSLSAFCFLILCLSDASRSEWWQRWPSWQSIQSLLLSPWWILWASSWASSKSWIARLLFLDWNHLASEARCFGLAGSPKAS